MLIVFVLLCCGCSGDVVCGGWFPVGFVFD